MKYLVYFLIFMFTMFFTATVTFAYVAVAVNNSTPWGNLAGVSGVVAFLTGAGALVSYENRQ